ncbi:hypothetical protein WJX73_005590 [Symbiochloris irregularis]|uniref:RRM domain-containing protein n=1 Tax=Symbiochloris irregularis TaxID=706552 RepID=A0AAW1NYB2_9CHLO
MTRKRWAEGDGGSAADQGPPSSPQSKHENNQGAYSQSPTRRAPATPQSLLDRPPHFQTGIFQPADGAPIYRPAAGKSDVVEKMMPAATPADLVLIGETLDFLRRYSMQNLAVPSVVQACRFNQHVSPPLINAKQQPAAERTILRACCLPPGFGPSHLISRLDEWGVRGRYDFMHFLPDHNDQYTAVVHFSDSHSASIALSKFLDNRKWADLMDGQAADSGRVSIEAFAGSGTHALAELYGRTASYFPGPPAAYQIQYDQAAFFHGEPRPFASAPSQLQATGVPDFRPAQLIRKPASAVRRVTAPDGAAKVQPVVVSRAVSRVIAFRDEAAFCPSR